MAFFPFFDRFPDKQALIRTQQSHLMGLCYFCMHLLNKGLQLCADKILSLILQTSAPHFKRLWWRRSFFVWFCCC